jgi:uncharacterized integral membrane protein (TIGR00697 family)
MSKHRQLSAGEIERRKHNLFYLLSGIFIANALIAEIIGVKIFSLERSLGLEPVGTSLVSFLHIEFVLTAGVMVWPVVFLTTDIINEYFGRKGVRKVTFLTIGLIGYAFVAIFLVSKLSPAPFWLEVNSRDAAGNAFDINFAFNQIFLQSTRIIIGSLLAFLVSQLLDVFVFQQLRAITGRRYLWLRATGSTLVSQLVDSFFVLFMAFYVLGNWRLDQVVQVGVNNYIYKFLVAIAVTPLIYLAHHLIDRYLGRAAADKMANAATQDRAIF